MQKFKHTASKYAVVSALALFIMIFLWFFFNWSYVNFKGDILFNYANGKGNTKQQALVP